MSTIRLPDFLSSIAKDDYEKKLAKAIEELNPIPGPVAGILLVTNRCNANCCYCFWNNQEEENTNSISELSLKDARLIIQNLYKIGVRYLHISGGEPTLYPSLFELINLASNLGMHVNIATNGTTLSDDLVLRLSESGLASFSLSLDSLDAKYNRETRINADLDYLRLDRYIKMLFDSDIWVGVNAVLYKQTPTMLRNMLKWCKDNSLGVQFQPVNKMAASSCREAAQQDIFHRQIDTLLELKESDHPIINSLQYLLQLKAQFYEPLRNCRIPWTQIVIDSDMNVSYCCLHKPYYKIHEPNEISEYIFPHYYTQRSIIKHFPESCADCSVYWTDTEK